MAKERDQSQQQQRQSGNGGEQRAAATRQGNGEQRAAAVRQGGDAGARMAPIVSPFTFMRQFVEDLDRLFGGLPREGNGGGDGGTAGGIGWVPAIEVFERDGRLVVRGDFPGVDKGQINVEIDEDRLVISGERREQHEERRGDVYRSERVYGRFHRVIPLPEGVQADQARATFANGVLEITIPLPSQQREGRRVAIDDRTETSQQRDDRAAAAT